MLGYQNILFGIRTPMVHSGPSIDVKLFDIEHRPPKALDILASGGKSCFTASVIGRGTCEGWEGGMG